MFIGVRKTILDMLFGNILNEIVHIWDTDQEEEEKQQPIDMCMHIWEFVDLMVSKERTGNINANDFVGHKH